MKHLSPKVTPFGTAGKMLESGYEAQETGHPASELGEYYRILSQAKNESQ